MNITKNFSMEEFSCACKKCENKISVQFIKKVQVLRDLVNFPLTINSGYRCEQHNKDVGGAMNSMHIKGIACDIGWDKLTQDQRKALLYRASGLFNGIGLHRNFIHLDDRPNPCVFFY